MKGDCDNITGFLYNNVANQFTDSSIILPYNQTGSIASASGNLDVMNRSRGEIIGNQQGKYGGFVHWRLYASSLYLAQEPIPNETGRQLSTF